MFEHFRSPCGLLYWGGHTFVDLRTLEVVHIEGPHMEIKMHLPYYDLMWEVDPEATAQFIRAYWNSNLRDWGRLEINRHAPCGRPLGDGGDEYLASTVDGLIAYAKHGYDPEKNVFRAMLGDGSDLTGYVIQRGMRAGDTIEAIPADAAFLQSCARAWRLSGEDALWATIRGIAGGNGLGDLGEAAGRLARPED